MKRLLIPFLLLLAAPVQAAPIIHKITATSQGIVDGSYSHIKAVPSTYSMSSTGTTIGTMGQLTAPAVSNGNLTGVAATYSASASVSQTTSGASTSFMESYQQGSATPSAASLTHAGLTSLPSGLDAVYVAGGSNNGMSIAITSVGGGTITLAPGAAGTSVTGSITSALQIGD
tara:strand:- start:2490 stop:3008 length:519 start_codon:yes stop_codon:yes gene_type:complete